MKFALVDLEWWIWEKLAKSGIVSRNSNLPKQIFEQICLIGAFYIASQEKKTKGFKGKFPGFLWLSKIHLLAFQELVTLYIKLLIGNEGVGLRQPLAWMYDVPNHRKFHWSLKLFSRMCEVLSHTKYQIFNLLYTYISKHLQSSF